MPSLSAVKAANAQYAPSYIPTAVFIGGNSGIGQAMAEALAKQTNGRANIVIVARNKESAEKVIAGFPSPPPASETNGVVIKHEFLACDASVMKNVHNTTQELLRRLDKINILVVSAGGLALSRVDTADGVDTSLALRYYSRAKFIEELTPLLSRAKAAGEDAKAMSILMAAGGGEVNLDDLDLDKKWSMATSATASATYNDIMVKVQAERHPDIAFIHIYPGVVDTPALRIHWILNIIVPLAKPFLRTPQDCAQSMLYPLLSPEFDKGGYWLTKNADKLTLGPNISDEVTKKVWEHTLLRAQIQ